MVTIHKSQRSQGQRPFTELTMAIMLLVGRSENVIWLYIKCFTYINSFILTTRPSREAQQGMAHSFIELDKAVDSCD